MTAMRTVLIAAVAGALLVPAAAEAQKKNKGKAADGELSKARRDKIRQKVRAMREWKLTEALELDSATADKLFPILDSYDEKFVAAMREGRQLRRKLRKGVESGKSDDKKIDKLVDAMLDNQRAIWELNEARFQAARKVLTAEQAAKALIVLPQIDQAIRRQMRKAAEGREGRRRGRKFKDPF